MKNFMGMIAVCAFVSMASTTPVLADGSSDAKAAFERAKKLYAKDNFAAAANAFRRAYKLKPNWKLLYNIGQAEMAARRFGLALEMFERYLSSGGDEINETRADEILKDTDKLQKMVGYIEFKSAPSGAVLTVDGVIRGETPLPGPIAISAGVEHTVVMLKEDAIVYKRVVRQPSRNTRTLDVSDYQPKQKKKATAEEDRADAPVANVETTEAEITDDAIEAAPVSSGPAPGKKFKIAGGIVTGVGAGMLVGGIIAGGMMLSMGGEIENECVNGCPPEREDDMNKVNSTGIAADVLLISGAVVTAVGITMLVVGVKKDKKNESVAFAPSFGQNFVGAAMQGRF